MLLTSMVHDSEDWLEPRESEKNTCKSCDMPMLYGNPIAVRTAHIESNISFLGQQLNHSFLWLSSSWQFIPAFENTYFYTYMFASCSQVFPWNIEMSHFQVCSLAKKNHRGPTIEATGASEIPSVFSSQLLGPGNMVSGIVCVSAAAYLAVPLHIFSGKLT